jgi:PAS domain S-box-containing protein
MDVKAKILLVDDKPDQLFALQTVLAELNQDLVTAHSGGEALRHVLAADFAVIILDVNMPIMDGFETAALIRQREQSEHTPIIFITAYDNTLTHVSQGYSLGAVDYIHRPVVPEILKAKVSAFVELYRKNEIIRRMQEEEHRKRLRENEERLESEARRNIFFVLSIDLLGITNFDGFFQQLNPAWEKCLGYSDEELKARPLIEFVHPDDLEHTRGQIHRLLAGDSIARCESRFRCRDGSWRWLGWTAAPFMSEKLIYIYARDVTERISIEEERARNLKREQERTGRFRRLAEAAISINSALTTNQILEVVTEEAARTIGAHVAMVRVAQEGAGRPPFGTSVVSEKYGQWRGRRLEQSEAYEKLRRYVSPFRLTQADIERDPELHLPGAGDNGTPPLRGWLSAPLTGRDGRLMGVIELSDKFEHEFDEQDESILIQLAQMASLAIENSSYFEAREANRLKDEFLATLSHELRTPLTAILNGAWLLKADRSDPDRFEGTIDMIDRNARTQVRLIEDMLDISRITSGKLQLDLATLDLASVLRQAVEALRRPAEERRLVLTFDPGDRPFEIVGDADRLNQIFMNLVSNSIKFTPPGGTVEVRLEVEDPFARVVVKDTGRGIDPAFLPWVFERFRQGDAASTRRFGGLGLGLSIVKHMVELHGGTVMAQSAGEGKGSTFTVRLPRAVPAADGRPRRDETAAAPLVLSAETLPGVRVLLVDDEVDSREVIQAVLEQCGASVAVAGSAEEAVNLLREASTSGRPFHVLVSDIAMPREDGYELIRRIRSLDPGGGGTVPAVALTAYAREVDRRMALNSGFQVHVAKPIEPGRLVQVVASLAETGKGAAGIGSSGAGDASAAADRG